MLRSLSTQSRLIESVLSLWGITSLQAFVTALDMVHEIDRTSLMSYVLVGVVMILMILASFEIVSVAYQVLCIVVDREPVMHPRVSRAVFRICTNCFFLLALPCATMVVAVLHVTCGYIPFQNLWVDGIVYP